jgi:hypothetical protein
MERGIGTRIDEIRGWHCYTFTNNDTLRFRSRQLRHRSCFSTRLLIKQRQVYMNTHPASCMEKSVAGGEERGTWTVSRRRLFLSPLSHPLATPRASFLFCSSMQATVLCLPPPPSLFFLRTSFRAKHRQKELPPLYILFLVVTERRRAATRPSILACRC